MQRLLHVTAFSTLAAIAAATLYSSDARADVVVGAGVGVAVPLSVKGYNAGLAVDGRLGYEFSISPVSLAIEAAGGYTTMPAEALAGTVSNAKITRIMAGLRLGFGTLIVPFAAAHVGYGWLSQSSVDPSGTEQNNSSKGLTMDAKIGFDIRPIHLFSFGANGGYNLLSGAQAAALGEQTIGASGALNYLTFGVQAALAF